MKNIKDSKKIQLVILSSTIILLLLLLFGLLVILSLNKNVKSESNDIMTKFRDGLNSDSYSLVYYYNSVDTESSDGTYQLDIIRNISKENKIDFIELDKSKLNSKNRKEIEDKLGLENDTFDIVLLKDGQIVFIKNKIVEGNRLVELLIEKEYLSKEATYSKTNNLKFIDYSEYKKVIKSKNKSIVVIGQAGCKYCAGVKEILNNISKAHKLEIYYLDVKELDQKDFEELFEKLPEMGFDSPTLISDESFDMPTLIIFKENKVENYLEGYKTLEQYKEFFKEKEIIK